MEERAEERERRKREADWELGDPWQQDAPDWMTDEEVYGHWFTIDPPPVGSEADVIGGPMAIFNKK